MEMSRFFPSPRAHLLLAPLWVSLACGGPEDPAPETPEATGPAEPGQGPLQPGQGPPTPGSYEPDAAVLAAADAEDGTVDHVVEKCVVCSMAMPGDPTQTVTLGDYELHMCSALCTEAFEADIPGTMDRVATALSGVED